MMPWRAGVVLAAGAVITASPQRVTPITDVARVMATYEAGDDGAVERWVRDAGATGAPSQAHRAVRHLGWSRTHAAFLLELAAALPEAHRRQAALETGLDLMASRASADLAFDAVYHAAAIAIAHDTADFHFQRAYLARAGDSAPRTALARGIAEAGVCCHAAGGRRAPPMRHAPPASLAEALRLFDAAASDPALAAEARVRGGVQLYWSRDLLRARAWLERAPDSGDDSLMAFAKHLFLARTLDALGLPAEAIPAYRAARAALPASQLPGIGLAAALMQTGRRDEAAQVAREVSAMLPSSIDPLAVIDAGDARFLREAMAAVREARRAR